MIAEEYPQNCLAEDSCQDLGRPLQQTSSGPVDFDFLSAQTFADVELQRDILTLFVAQARRILPIMPGQTGKEQADTAHLLKGSARGIGAWAAADAAERYESTPALARHLAFADLTRAFAEVEAAIADRLAGLSRE
jgi:HPt (histidine-containing phosphotransfer) domain-containing protein